MAHDEEEHHHHEYDEPVPARVVRDDRDTRLKRATLIIFILIIIALVARDFQQSYSNGDDIGTANKRIGRLIDSNQRLSRQIANLEDDARVNTVVINRLRKIVDQQNKIIVGLGGTPVDSGGTFNPRPHPTPQPSPGSTPQPTPTHKPPRHHHHHHKHHKPSPSPSPTGLLPIICGTTPLQVPVLCTNSVLVWARF